MADGSQASAERARRTWGHQGSGHAHTGPKAPIRFPEPEVSPAPLMVRLSALKVGCCHWVVGDDHLYCGQQAQPGSSYCTGHHKHVYQPRTYPINEAAILARLDQYGPIADAVPTVSTEPAIRVKPNITKHY